MFSWRKGNVVVEMIDRYLARAEECFQHWRKAFNIYLEQGLGPEFDELVTKTHIAESTCDDIRRQVEETLYEKALIPEARGDIVFLLEGLDQVPSQADRVVHQIQCELLAMPPQHAAAFRELVDLNCECFSHLAQAVRLVFTDMTKVKDQVMNVDKTESATDHLQHELIRAIFTDDNIKTAQRILLKDLVTQVNLVSDLAEQSSDRLTLLAVKRVV